MRFETTNGTVAAVVAASGRVTTAAEHAAQVQERFDDAGNLLSVYSPAQGLMLCSDGDNGEKILSWFAPAQVSVDESGNYTFEGDNEQKAITELEDLLNMEVEPVIDPIDIPITEDLKISVNDMGMIEAFINFTEEV